jgi:predicted Zn-dependent protease
MKKIQYLLFALIMVLATGCTDKNDNFIISTIDRDIELGLQVSEEIRNNPTQYPILDKAEYTEAYSYIENLLDIVLETGEVQYKEEFAWEIYIIEDDSVLNAFATPGGYVYFYTGLIKYLDEEDDLMGVMGHEIAHSDLRHTIQNIEDQQGLSFLLSLLTGDDPSQLTEIAGQVAGTLAGLSFSRKFESEADDRSVEYLAKTKYACNGAFSFFQKLLDADASGSTPEFLSTHPNPADRVADINNKASQIGCNINQLAPASYADFKKMLP